MARGAPTRVKGQKTETLIPQGVTFRYVEYTPVISISCACGVNDIITIKVMDDILNAVAAALAGSRFNRRGTSAPNPYCTAANTAGRLVNINENTSAAAHGNAAGCGADGSNALNSFGKTARRNGCSAARRADATAGTSGNKRCSQKRQGMAGQSAPKAMPRIRSSPSEQACKPLADRLQAPRRSVAGACRSLLIWTKPARVHCKTLQTVAESKTAAGGRLSGRKERAGDFCPPCAPGLSYAPSSPERS
jgi:hypothetical protein